MANEASVHMLTAIRFPPPALLFANPGKKWTMGDFEKSNNSSSYSVTDEEDVLSNTERIEQPQDRITTVAGEPQPETTITEKPVDGTKDDRGQALSTAENATVEAQQEQVTTTKIVDGTGDDEKQTISVENPVGGQGTIAVGKPIDETGTDLAKESATVEKPIDGMPNRGPQGGATINKPSANTRFEKLTVTLGRRKYLADIWRPFRTIMLTSRPLPTPTSVRFSQVNYTGVRQHRETPATG